MLGSGSSSANSMFLKRDVLFRFALVNSAVLSFVYVFACSGCFDV
jgi:hypothetical protein